VKITTLDEHSFDLESLSKEYPILDVGCRGFSLSKHLVELGYTVVAIDPDPIVKNPNVQGIRFENVALTSKRLTGTRELTTFGNGTGNYIITPTQQQDRHLVVAVNCVDIETLSKNLSIQHWSAIKLDCEGSEYEILLEWPGPIADQISVEFHEHVPGANPNGDKYFEKMISHLSNWYNVDNFIKEKRHCLATPNYWDVLFTLKF
jgi:FkbM family methyltransferase